MRRLLAVAARAGEPARARDAIVAPAGARSICGSSAVAAPTAQPHDASALSEPPLSPATLAALELESRYAAHNYSPVPVVLSRGEGVHVFDVDDKRYIDALSGYSAVNQGHAHPRIVAALSAQAARLGLVSRAFTNDAFGPYAEFITRLFGYDKVLPANTGVETGETAVKLCRRWGYDVKGIPTDKARIVFAAGGFWGRTIGAISASTDPSSYSRFGPFVPGFDKVPFDDLPALERALSHPHVCGFMVEPIQGEAGVILPSSGYLPAAAALCRKHNALFVADEVQTGLGRTGALLACHTAGVRPDILCLGKALGGGLYPVSAVLADDHVMLGIKPGEHGSTWGGNPVACAVATASLHVILDEKLAENAAAVGELMRTELRALAAKSDGRIGEVRGAGLLNAMIINPQPGGLDAWQFCLRLAHNGMITKPTQDVVVRLAPPLTLTPEQCLEMVDIIGRTLQSFD